MKNPGLRYYMHEGPTAFRFELAGNLDYKSAPRLDQDWQTASSAIANRRLIVDMTFVTGVDEKGGALLRRWHQEGARLIANSKLSRVLAESILGEPLPASGGDASVSDRTWLPFRASFLVSAATLLTLATITFPVEAKPATLKSTTVIAWDYISRTTRVQEVEDYGQPGEYRKPEGEGSGYIWELYGIARFEQRDDGVYVAMEAIGLSRDIPVAVRLVVDPIVRRVSRNSLLTSLQKTEEAVRGGFATLARSSNVPEGAQQLRGVPAPPSNKSCAFTQGH
jgi:hypothetical protein